MHVTAKHSLFVKVLKIMFTSHNFVYKQHVCRYKWIKIFRLQSPRDHLKKYFTKQQFVNLISYFILCSLFCLKIHTVLAFIQLNKNEHIT